MLNAEQVFILEFKDIIHIINIYDELPRHLI